MVSRLLRMTDWRRREVCFAVGVVGVGEGCVGVRVLSVKGRLYCGRCGGCKVKGVLWWVG